LLEIRSDGHQTMMPPSVHPNGEQIAWECEGEPARVSGDELAQSVTRLAIACLLVRHWPAAGARHDFALALAAALLDGGLDPAQARHPIEVVSRQVGDNEVDDRVRCVDSTVRKREAGAPVLGASLLLETLPPTVAKTLLSWLDINHDELSVVEAFNKEYAVVPVGGRTVILRERRGAKTGLLAVEFMRKQDFELLHFNKTFMTSGKSASASRFWLTHPDRRTYDQMVFQPGQVPPNSYNLWRGFAVVPRDGSCERFLDHVHRTICCGDEIPFRYVVAWMADAVQNPTRRPGTALALRGREGTGKGVFCREFGKLFGQHFKHVSHPRHFTGNFNAHLMDCCLLYADEAFWAGDKTGEGVLKALITEPTIMIEMNKDVIQMPNYVRILISSNHDLVVPTGFEARRFLVLDISDAHM
jgi:hypothetical protein